MQKIKNYLNKIINSRFARDLGIVFTENVLSRGLNFIIILLLTRMLGPEDYGKYSLIFVLMMFLQGFFDLGMENTIVRFSNKEKKHRDSLFGLYFLTKSIILFFLILNIILFGENILISFGKGEIAEYLPYLVAGIGGLSLLFVNDTYLQAIKNYVLRAFINILRYILTLIYILILYFNKILFLKYVFVIYFIPLCIALFFIPKYIKFLTTYLTQKIEKNLFKNIISYEKWMLVLSIANILLGRIDFIMLSFWVGFAELGIYNASFQLACVAHFIPFVFGKVMLPKVSGFNNDEIYDFTQKIIKPIIVLSLGIFVGIFLVDIIVPFLFGPEYVAGINILKILLIASVFAILAVPYEQALFSLGKPKIIALTKHSLIILIVVLNILTIPQYGMIWAAINLAIGRFFILLIYLVVFKYLENIKLLNNHEIIYSKVS